MQRTHGDFIAISDQDDIWEGDKLEVQINAIGYKHRKTYHAPYIPSPSNQR